MSNREFFVAMKQTIQCLLGRTEKLNQGMILDAAHVTMKSIMPRNQSRTFSCQNLTVHYPHRSTSIKPSSQLCLLNSLISPNWACFYSNVATVRCIDFCVWWNLALHNYVQTLHPLCSRREHAAVLCGTSWDFSLPKCCTHISSLSTYCHYLNSAGVRYTCT